MNAVVMTRVIIFATIVAALISSTMLAKHYHNKYREYQNLYEQQKAEVDRCFSEAKKMESENKKFVANIESLQKQNDDNRKECNRRVDAINEKWRIVAEAKFKQKPQPGVVIDDETSRRSVDYLNRLWGVQPDGEAGGVQHSSDNLSLRPGGKAESQARNEERGLVRTNKPRRAN